MLTDVVTLWDALARESTATGKYLERLVRPDSEVEIVLGYGGGRFALAIKADFPQSWEKNLQLPSSIRCERDSIASSARIRLRFCGSGLESIFIWFSQDVANRLYDVPVSAVPDNLELALTEWAEAFRIDPKRGMSRQAQQGLFAELFFMEEVLTPILAGNALLAWHSQNSVHDFQSGQTAWEVKSYGGRRLEVRISNEDQLDSVGLNKLILVVIALKVSNEAGRSVHEIAQQLLADNSQNIPLLRHLQTGLAKYGYIDESSLVRKYFFTPRRMSEYLVKEEFPKLVRKQLPCAISNVKYVLSLTSLEKYLIKPSIEF